MSGMWLSHGGKHKGLGLPSARGNALGRPRGRKSDLVAHTSEGLEGERRPGEHPKPFNWYL